MPERKARAGTGGLPRRAVIGAAAGGVVAAHLPPYGIGPADAAVVTPNPIVPPITKGSIRLSLQPFCTPTFSSATRPRSMLNYLYHAGDGSGRLFAADSRGRIWAISAGGTVDPIPFLDLQARVGTIVIEASTKYLGLRTFAFHPDFANPLRPGFRKLYTVNTEIPANPAGVPVLCDPALPVNHDDVIAEWQTNAAGTRVEPASRREVVRIRQWNRGHNTDQLLFNPNTEPGKSDYGLMYISVGDGKNNPPHTDPYDQAQNPLSPLGKILRINPLKLGARSYSVPGSNPFFGRSGWLSEIWALGLRHPEFLCFDTAGKKQLVIGHVGQHQIEAVYVGAKGANYGWPAREGTFATDRLNQYRLSTLPPDDASLGYTYPVAQYDHDEGVALCGGYVYRGTAIPALKGQYLFGDIFNGRVFAVPVASFRPGSPATIQEVTLVQSGVTVTLRGLLATTLRVDLRFGQDQAGDLYLTTKQDGVIRKLGAG